MASTLDFCDIKVGQVFRIMATLAGPTVYNEIEYLRIKDLYRSDMTYKVCRMYPNGYVAFYTGPRQRGQWTCMLVENKHGTN